MLRAPATTLRPSDRALSTVWVRSFSARALSLSASASAVLSTSVAWLLMSATSLSVRDLIRVACWVYFSARLVSVCTLCLASIFFRFACASAVLLTTLASFSILFTPSSVVLRMMADCCSDSSAWFVWICTAAASIRSTNDEGNSMWRSCRVSQSAWAASSAVSTPAWRASWMVRLSLVHSSAVKLVETFLMAVVARFRTKGSYWRATDEYSSDSSSGRSRY
mmetsp:Transcript_23896/g.59998  ORF Transcript_23896/g.59998 Transcript_23896/m.59998 type:complete len:222 (-) Transcript_23896:595-1260(-)